MNDKEEDGEEEWEEQLVAVELIGMIDPDKLNMIDAQNTAALGVASEELTILKLGGYAFAGKYEDAIGSVVVFEDTGREDEDTARLKYLGHTTKVLKANRIFLKAKGETAPMQTLQKQIVPTLEKKIECEKVEINISTGPDIE